VVLVELVVAELVEALDHACGWEALLHDHAGAVCCGRELAIFAVHRLPVVHRVDEDLAGEQIAWKLAEAMRGDGQDDDVRLADDLLGRRRSRAGGQHVDGQRDHVGRPRSRHHDVVTGRDGGACECRAELARADDAEAQIVDLDTRFADELVLGERHRHPRPLAATGAASGVAASSSRTRGITSRP
jgi:hypothetical protein